MYRLLTAAVIGVVTAATSPFLVAPPATAAAVTTTDGCLTSIPDPGTTAPVQICYTLFRPAGATKAAPVPMVLHSHGWGGSRTQDPASFSYLTDAGFGVLSFDQRGFGESGGHAYIENPDVEGTDVQKIVDLVAAQPWVAKQKPGDPVLGAIGGSYGGGYQFVGAFSELRDTGTTRFDALVPAITWWSLTESLFPLHHGLKDFQRALTDKARSRSIFVGCNGGHTLPSALPAGTNYDIPLAVNDACSPTLGLTGFGRYHLTTAAGRCVNVPSVAPSTTVELGDVVSTVGVGAPIAYPIAQGPLTIAGSPTLDASISTIGLDNRAFLALSVGTSPLDAKIVQNNMLPIRANGIALNKPRTGIELPSVAVDVPAGQTLFLTVSPVSDMYAGFGSRVVGAMTLREVLVHLPVTTR